VVIRNVLEILVTEASEVVHNHHNFAWREEHDGETYRSSARDARPPSLVSAALSARRWARRA
jgi:hypothetical protein